MLGWKDTRLYRDIPIVGDCRHTPWLSVSLFARASVYRKVVRVGSTYLRNTGMEMQIHQSRHNQLVCPINYHRRSFILVNRIVFITRPRADSVNLVISDLDQTRIEKRVLIVESQNTGVLNSLNRSGMRD